MNGETIVLYRGPCKVKYYEGPVIIIADAYENLRLALQVISDEEVSEPVLMATVNLPDDELDPDEVFIKDYSENEGTIEFLKAAGIIEGEPTRIAHSRFAQIPAFKLTEEVLEKVLPKVEEDDAEDEENEIDWDDHEE